MYKHTHTHAQVHTDYDGHNIHVQAQIDTHIHTLRQTHAQTGRQTDRQRARQTDGHRQTDRQTHISNHLPEPSPLVEVSSTELYLRDVSS